MLSILIPTYNYNITALVTELHAQATAEGIPFEIIVIDDCSSDNSIVNKNKTIDDLPSCYFFQNSINVGRTATRNALSTKSSYDWLLFLDADVLPLDSTFVSNYLKELYRGYDVIFGGISYAKNKPSDNLLLRWEYGNKREAKKSDIRQKKPFNVISQNILLKKNVFNKANSLETHMYGLDILFSHNLKKIDAKVLHIENNIVHLGLEDTANFMRKSLQSVETTFRLEQLDKMDDTSRPLQIKYNQLRKMRLLNIFNFLTKKFRKKIETNLYSKNPSLILFDFYRLHHYSNLKKNA